MFVMVEALLKMYPAVTKGKTHKGSCMLFRYSPFISAIAVWRYIDNASRSKAFSSAGSKNNINKNFSIYKKVKILAFGKYYFMSITRNTEKYMTL